MTTTTPPPYFHPTNHRQTRRMFGHNYAAVGTYLITMVTHERWRVFGEVVGDVKAPRGTAQWPHLAYTPLGQQVIQSEIGKIHQLYPMVEVWKLQLMPDHLHMILRVNSALPEGSHLGIIVRGFKKGCTRAWWKLSGPTGLPKDEQGRDPLLFEEGYNDHILMNEGQLSHWKNYLNENPLRLLLRRTYPDLMRRSLCITIQGIRYSAFGNFLLLKRPDKLQVFCHRNARYAQLSEQERTAAGLTTCLYAPDYTTRIPYIETAAFVHEQQQLLSAARQGTVLVTPGISPGEKQIKNEAITARLPLIHLQRETITAHWKPEDERFHACADGSLLILAPWKDDLQGETDYAQFHNLNLLASSLCSMEDVETKFRYL